MAVEDNSMSALTGWAGAQKSRIPRPRDADRGIAFALYGRMSTSDYQNAVTSRQWQRDNADELIAGKGWIVAEFFDEGCSRRLRWNRRPQASTLLAAIADPGRQFTAVVVGEFERAFCGNQFTEIMPMLREHGVQLWLPELAGPVDFDDPDHMAVLVRPGLKSKLEISLCQSRAIAAMMAQTREQGRFLGGRPPYGYRLVDAGAHPNRVHAGWGRRLRKLEPDPQAAPRVQVRLHVVVSVWPTRLHGFLHEHLCSYLKDKSQVGTRIAAHLVQGRLAELHPVRRYRFTVVA